MNRSSFNCNALNYVSELIKVEFNRLSRVRILYYISFHLNWKLKKKSATLINCNGYWITEFIFRNKRDQERDLELTIPSSLQLIWPAIRITGISLTQLSRLLCMWDSNRASHSGSYRNVILVFEWHRKTQNNIMNCIEENCSIWMI